MGRFLAAVLLAAGLATMVFGNVWIGIGAALVGLVARVALRRSSPLVR
jgi:hypothetical protein